MTTEPEGDAGIRAVEDRPLAVFELLRLPYPARAAGEIAMRSRRQAAELEAQAAALIYEARQLEDLIRAALATEARHDG